MVPYFAWGAIRDGLTGQSASGIARSALESAVALSGRGALWFRYALASLFASLALTILLGRIPIARVVLLGKWRRPAQADVVVLSDATAEDVPRTA